MTKSDSTEYLEKKRLIAQLLTVYGRKPVLEALTTKGIEAYRLHLCESNQNTPIIQEIIAAATGKGAEILYHSKEELARISKNKKQDQGVAADLKLENFMDFEKFIQNPPPNFELIALDNITNPQNLGMIIRSVSASPITGLLLPRRGCAKLNALVIKATAGALFKAKIIRCENLTSCLNRLRKQGADIVGLDLHSKRHFSSLSAHCNRVFVVGNESEGISPQIRSACSTAIKIPMRNGVESLNVAITASLIAFRNAL